MPKSLVYTGFTYLYSSPLGPVFEAKRIHDGVTVCIRTVSLSETHRMLWPSYRTVAGQCLTYHHPNIAVANAVYLDEQGHRFLMEFPRLSAFNESTIQSICSTARAPLSMHLAWDIINQITIALEWLHNPPSGALHIQDFHGHLSPANITYDFIAHKVTLYDVGFSMIPGPTAPMASESLVQIHDDRFKAGMPADMYALGSVIALLLAHVDKKSRNFVEEMVSLKNACQHPCNHALISFQYIISMSSYYKRRCRATSALPNNSLIKSSIRTPGEEQPLDMRFQKALDSADSSQILSIIEESLERQIPVYVHTARSAIPVEERTPLMEAADRGNADRVRECLEHLGKSHEGTTALMLASKRGHADCIKLLLGELGITDTNGFTALMKAADQPVAQNVCNSGLLYILPEARMHAPSGWTAMMFAASEGNTSLVAALMNREAGMRNRDGRTALMYAAFNGYEQIVKTLIAAESNLVDSKRKRAIDYAIEQNNLKCVRVLLSREIIAPVTIK